MHQQRRILAVVAAALLAAGCGLGEGDEISADGEWQQFSVDGQFSADFPGEPEVESGTTGGETYLVENRERAVSVLVFELPAEVPPELFEGMLTELNEQIVAGMNGTIVEQATVSDAPYPAEDLEFTATVDDDDILGLTRATLVGGHEFQLMAMGFDGDRAEVEAIFDRLVESFEPEALP